MSSSLPADDSTSLYGYRPLQQLSQDLQSVFGTLVATAVDTTCHLSPGTERACGTIAEFVHDHQARHAAAVPLIEERAINGLRTIGVPDPHATTIGSRTIRAIDVFADEAGNFMIVGAGVTVVGRIFGRLGAVIRRALEVLRPTTQTEFHRITKFTVRLEPNGTAMADLHAVGNNAVLVPSQELQLLRGSSAAHTLKTIYRIKDIALSGGANDLELRAFFINSRLRDAALCRYQLIRTEGGLVSYDVFKIPLTGHTARPVRLSHTLTHTNPVHIYEQTTYSFITPSTPQQSAIARIRFIRDDHNSGTSLRLMREIQDRANSSNARRLVLEVDPNAPTIRTNERQFEKYLSFLRRHYTSLPSRGGILRFEIPLERRIQVTNTPAARPPVTPPAPPERPPQISPSVAPPVPPERPPQTTNRLINRSINTMDYNAAIAEAEQVLANLPVETNWPAGFQAPLREFFAASEVHVYRGPLGRQPAGIIEGHFVYRKIGDKGLFLIPKKVYMNARSNFVARTGVDTPLRFSGNLSRQERAQHILSKIGDIAREQGISEVYLAFPRSKADVIFALDPAAFTRIGATLRHEGEQLRLIKIAASSLRRLSPAIIPAAALLPE